MKMTTPIKILLVVMLLLGATCLGWWAGGLCEPWGDDYQRMSN